MQSPIIIMWYCTVVWQTCAKLAIDCSKGPNSMHTYLNPLPLLAHTYSLLHLIVGLQLATGYRYLGRQLFVTIEMSLGYHIAGCWRHILISRNWLFGPDLMGLEYSKDRLHLVLCLGEVSVLMFMYELLLLITFNY